MTKKTVALFTMLAICSIPSIMASAQTEDFRVENPFQYLANLQGKIRMSIISAYLSAYADCLTKGNCKTEEKLRGKLASVLNPDISFKDPESALKAVNNYLTELHSLIADYKQQQDAKYVLHILESACQYLNYLAAGENDKEKEMRGVFADAMGQFYESSGDAVNAVAKYLLDLAKEESGKYYLSRKNWLIRGPLVLNYIVDANVSYNKEWCEAICDANFPDKGIVSESDSICKDISLIPSSKGTMLFEKINNSEYKLTLKSLQLNYDKTLILKFPFAYEEVRHNNHNVKMRIYKFENVDVILSNCMVDSPDTRGPISNYSSIFVRVKGDPYLWYFNMGLYPYYIRYGDWVDKFWN
ncbi:MAG: hypothetical protein NTW04_06325 [Elusimicrobia bacterium]|nr:hypothetical protein [Elusimicrobiota bacterium]